MTEIYIVTSGSYSDYQIEGVFTDENVAGKFQALLDDGNDGEVMLEF